MKASGELEYRIRYDVEHDLFHAQNVFNDEYIKPTFIEYVQKLEKENAELKADNDARKFAMAMSEKVEKKLREENVQLKGLVNQYKASKCGSISLVNRNMIMSDQLTKAKELLKEFVHHYKAKTIYIENMQDLLEQAEQFLSEVEKCGQ